MATYDTRGFLDSSDKFQYLKDWAAAGGLANQDLTDLFDMAISQDRADQLVNYDPNTSLPDLVLAIIVNETQDLIIGANIFQKIDINNEQEKILLSTYFSQTSGYISLLAIAAPGWLAWDTDEDGETTRIISTLIYTDPEVQKAFLELLYYAYINDRQFFNKPRDISTISNIPDELRINFLSVINDKVSAAAQAAGLGNFGLNQLAQAEGNNSEEAAQVGAIVAAQAGSGADGEVIEKSFEEEDLRNFLQCALLKDFVNTYTNIADGSFGSIKYIETEDKKIIPYKGRVIPLKMNDPGQFLNLCNFPRDMKKAFLRSSRMSNASMIPSFKYMRPKTSDTDDNYIVGHEEIDLQLNQGTADIVFTNLTIDFDGTNPSTARKDVKVKIELKLKNLGCLDYNIATLNNKYLFELYKLITVPYGVQQDSSVGGSLIRNQYSPDYNRIRMTLNSKMTSEINFGNKKQPDLKEVEFKKYQTFDLAIESHEINRSDDGVTMTLNYRGYFQSLLSHPFMDALATAGVMEERIAADKELSELGNSCSSETIKEIIRINRMADLQNAKDHSWTKFINNVTMNTKVKWIHYKCNNQDLRTFGFTNSLNYSNADNKLCKWSKGLRYRNVTGVEGVLDTLLEAQEKMLEKKINNNEVITEEGQVNSAFTTIGSIMQVALESLYDGEDGADLHPKFKHLNLKFLVAPIEIRSPQNPNLIINFNPLELPVDLLFFNQWFESTIINKGITYYPVLTMIRDLIERLVNSLLLEMCFDNSQPDELPPLLRVSFFNDNTDTPIVPTNAYAYKITQAAIFDGRQRIFEHRPKSDKTLNTYCVIYSQNRGNYITPSDLKNYRSSQYIPVFQHGHRLTTIEEGETTGDSPLSNVSFSKENMTGLKEARFFSSGGGGLNVLSNVYNLGFDLTKKGANVFIYPGQIIEFNLLDFDEYNDKWWKPDALSSIMGFGGFYVIKKTSITIKSLAGGDFTIHYDALWSGNGAGVEFRKSNDKNKIIEAETACADAFENAKDRYRLAGGTDQIETSVEAPRTTTNPTQSGTRWYGQSEDNTATAAASAEGNIDNAITQYAKGAESNNEYRKIGTTIKFTNNTNTSLNGRESKIIVKGVYQPSDYVQQIKVGVVDKETGIEAEYQVNLTLNQMSEMKAEYIKISR